MKQLLNQKQLASSKPCWRLLIPEFQSTSIARLLNQLERRMDRMDDGPSRTCSKHRNQNNQIHHFEPALR